MRQLILSFALIILLPFQLLFSQSQLKDLMDKLPVSNRESNFPVIPIKSTLPCNFYRNIGSSYIGISDVGMDSTTAYNQAFLRALSMIAFQNGRARGMSDFYNDNNGEQISSNYEELCEINTTTNLPVAGLKISDSFILNTGEFVLFLNVDSANVDLEDRINTNISAAIYYKENEIAGSRRIINKILLESKMSCPDKSKDHTEKLTYILSNNRWLGNETLFDGQKINTDRYKIFYEPVDECISDTTGCKIYGTSSVDGLWYALINNMSRQLSSQLKERFLNVKQVGDAYQNEIKTLNRESGFFRFSCNIKKVALVDNKLITHLETNFPNQ
ncbi:MAG: hypothetical protein WC542_05935 [Paludibacter sp.]